MMLSAANKVHALKDATFSKFFDMFPQCPALMAAYPESSPTVTVVHNFRCDVDVREDGRAIGRRCGFCFRNASMDDGSVEQGLPGLIQFKIRLPEDSDAVAHAKGPLFSKRSSLTVKLEADFLKTIFGEPTIALTDGVLPISFAGVPLGLQLPGIGYVYLALEFTFISDKEELGLGVRVNACADIKVLIFKGPRHCLTNGLPFLHTMLPLSHNVLSAIFLPGHVDPLHLDHSEASEQNKNSIGFHADDTDGVNGSSSSEATHETGTLTLDGSGSKLTAEESDVVMLLCDKNKDGKLNEQESHACFDNIVAAATSAEPNDPPAAVAFGDGEL
jgi:hypothetical protein